MYISTNSRLSDFPFTFHFHALEKEMATHSSILAWRIPGTGKPGGLPSMGSHGIGHDWSDLAAAAWCVCVCVCVCVYLYELNSGLVGLKYIHEIYLLIGIISLNAACSPFFLVFPLELILIELKTMTEFLIPSLHLCLKFSFIFFIFISLCCILGDFLRWNF